MSAGSVAGVVAGCEVDPWEGLAVLAGFAFRERADLLDGYVLWVEGGGCEFWLPADLGEVARARQVKALLLDLFAAACGLDLALERLRQLRAAALGCAGGDPGAVAAG